jgi:catechol 2,3-dioxygenase-like lactoylglutathione lyase family enzyme
MMPLPHRLPRPEQPIHASFLPHGDPDASLAFYRETLGFEVRNDVGYGEMRWITAGPADQPGTSIVLHPPAADPVGCRLAVPTVDFIRASPFVLTRPYTPGRCDPRLQE